VSPDRDWTLSRLPGKRKAAILLVALGRDAAASVFRHMKPREVEEISGEIARLGSVPVDVIDEVVAEFHANAIGARKSKAAGLDYARSVLDATYGTEEAGSMLGRILESSGAGSFEVLQHLDAGRLLSFLKEEHPQTIALVLVHLPPRRAGAVMAGLPAELQGDVALRMARIGPVAPGALRTIEEQLERHASSGSLVRTDVGGPDAVVNVLHQVNRATEDSILETIAEQDEELAEEIRQRMFVFADIMKLDDRAITAMLKEVDVKELSLALKGTTAELKEKIFENMSRRAREGILEDMEYMGPVRRADVEEAQLQLLAVLRRLEEEGTLALDGGGDTLVA
jgi:flagellar motor switch protein FliG